MKKRIIEELGELELEPGAAAAPGRKRVLIDLRADYACAIGIEFNESWISFCMADLRGNTVEKEIFPATYHKVANITEFLTDRIEALIQKHQEVENRLVGIGIGIPGKLDVGKNELVEESAVWKSFDPQELKKRFRLPVVMDNNVRCMACGQYLFSPANTPETFVFFHLGMGMYCANMVAGELFEADNYIAGEIGHTIVKIGGKKCECGKCGCLQTYASERALIREARLLRENHASVILNSVAGDRPISTEHVLAAYQLGDEIISQYVNDALQYLSMAISNLSIMTNTSRIFIHGRLFEDPTIMERFRMYIEKDLKFMGHDYFSHIEIVPYAPEDGALGACAKVIRTCFINE